MSVIEYNPVAGLTIRQALQNAKTTASMEHKNVVANLNDVIMCISSRTNVDKALQLYAEKLALKYEVEKIKRIKQK